MRNRFPVQLAAGATWSGANQKHFAPYSWIHLENRGVIGSGNDVLVDVISKSQLTQTDPDGYWRYLAAGMRLTANICGPEDAPAESLTLANIGATEVVVFVEISSTPIINFSDWPFEPAGGGGGGGTVIQGAAAALAAGAAWPVEISDALGHGPATVTAAAALKVDGSAVTQPVSQAAVVGAAIADGWATTITDLTHGPAAVKAASVAPVATDPALVVATSPNSPGVRTTPASAVAIAAGSTTADTVVVNPPTGANFLVVVVNISAISGGESLTLTINGQTVTAYTYPLLAAAALTAVGVTPYRVGPALNPSAGAVANDIIPHAVQLVVAIAGTGAVTYGVDVVYGD